MTNPAQNPVAGILWMVVTGLSFVAVNVLVKIVGSDLPSVQAAFVRFVLGLVFVMPLIKDLLAIRWTPTLVGVTVLRGAGHTLAVALWFYAMTQITVAEVTAMNYMNPVYVTLGAALIFGERLALRRLLAVAAALIGAALILRPGFRELSSGHFAMVFTAMAFAVSYLSAKRLSQEISAALVVALMTITVTIGLAPFAIAVWVMPTLQQLLLLFATAVFATLGHYAMTRAFKAAPLAVTQPVIFLQLVWAVILGAVLFDEPVDPFVLAGGGLIVAAISYIAWREHVLARGDRV